MADCTATAADTVAMTRRPVTLAQEAIPLGLMRVDGVGIDHPPARIRRLA